MSPRAAAAVENPFPKQSSADLAVTLATWPAEFSRGTRRSACRFVHATHRRKRCVSSALVCDRAALADALTLTIASELVSERCGWLKEAGRRRRPCRVAENGEGVGPRCGSEFAIEPMTSHSAMTGQSLILF